MTKEEKLDLYKLNKDEYIQPKKPKLIETKPTVYLSITGSGQPGDEEFQAKIGALYGMAYTIKMTRKFDGLGDYTICKLEGIYQFDDKKENLSKVPSPEWKWKLMIRTPDFISQKDLDMAIEKLIQKGKDPEVKNVVLDTIDEGLCVQMLHVGPYDEECKTIKEMMDFVEGEGMEFHGRHHDIYISDPRRVSPERLKTIIRHPVRKV